MRASADRFHTALDAAGVPHFYWMYGRPGPSAPFGCDGGHNFGCWNFALNDALPRMMAVLQAPGVHRLRHPSRPPRLWQTAASRTRASARGPARARAAPTTAAGLARTGTGNGWVRNNTGWNDLHQTIAVSPNRTYTVTAWVRTSANNTDGYSRAAHARRPGARRAAFGRLDGYTQLTVNVSTGSNTSVVLFGGLWANGDTWLQIDDVSAVRQ